MGKIMYALLMVFSIEFALTLFGGQNIVSTTLYDFVSNPTVIKSSAIFAAVIIALGLFAKAVVTPGQYAQVNLFAMYAGLAIVFIYFLYSIVHLHVWLVGQLSTLMASQQLAGFITTMITAPLLIFYMIAVVEWVRSNQ